MDTQQIITMALGIECGALGWFARELYNDIQGLKASLSALEVQITRDYIRYDRLQDALKPIMSSLEEIKHTLSGKADK